MEDDEYLDDENATSTTFVPVVDDKTEVGNDNTNNQTANANLQAELSILSNSNKINGFPIDEGKSFAKDRSAMEKFIW